MQWKPTPWIAAVLGLFVTPPLGLLYVQRPKLAVGYLALSTLIAALVTTSMFGLASAGATSFLGMAAWAIPIGCAVHAFTIARSAAPLAQRAWYSRPFGLIGLFAAVFGAVFLFRSFFYDTFRVPSESMYPTLPPGSVVFVQKSGHGHYGTRGIELWRAPPSVQIGRGDIVVHRLVVDPATIYVSRVVAIPGDRIRYVDRHLILNGTPVPTTVGATDGIYQYAVERIDDRDVTVAWIPARPSKDFTEVVPPDQLVVFGDNRDNARDSRYIGMIPRENVVGHVVKILRPHGAVASGAGKH